MTRECELRDTVLQILQRIAPEADIEGIDPEQSFRDQFGIDSIDFLNFVMALEQELGLAIAEIDYPKLSTLAGSLSYLQPRVNSANTATTS